MSNLAALASVFICILLGYLAKHFRYVQEQVERGLTEFVFKVSVPALIFLAMAQQTDSQGSMWGYWISYFGGAALVWALCAWLACRYLQQDKRSALLMGFSTSQSNTVFVGVPLILQAFGPQASYPLFMLLAVHMPVMMGAASFIIEADGSKPVSHQVRGLAQVLGKNPIFVALMAGLLWKLLPISVPELPEQILKTLAQCASACALFALGMSIHRLGIRGHMGPISLVVTGKLLLHPLAVWVLATFVFDMPPLFTAVATMFAAMPIGINSYLLASKYQAGEATVASSIALSTLLAAGSALFWLFLVHPL